MSHQSSSGFAASFQVPEFRMCTQMLDTLASQGSTMLNQGSMWAHAVFSGIWPHPGPCNTQDDGIILIPAVPEVAYTLYSSTVSWTALKRAKQGHTGVLYRWYTSAAVVSGAVGTYWAALPPCPQRIPHLQKAEDVFELRTSHIIGSAEKAL